MHKHYRDLRKIIVVMLFAGAGFAVWSLVSGAAYLDATLPGGLPLGNALSAFGPCAVAGAVVLLSTPRTALRAVSVGSLIAGVFWLPASIFLAGNLALNNFDGWRSLAWFIYTGVVVSAALGSLLWALAASLLAMRRSAGAAQHQV